MGYREDLAANYTINRTGIDVDGIKTAITASTLQAGVKTFLLKLTNVLIINEDLMTQKAIKRLLQNKQNLFQNRYRAAYEKYIALHPDVSHMSITPQILEEVDPGIAENYRQVMTYEQGTISGKARDALDKVEQNLEVIITVTEK
jgi:hypothetical protein